MKTTSAEHGQNIFCPCSFHGNSMKNLLSYCGLVDARISASEKPVPALIFFNKAAGKYRIHIIFQNVKIIQEQLSLDYPI